VDELRTGERKEGAYFAAWNFVQKAAGGLSIAIAGLTLELAGLHAGGEVNPLGVRLVSSALPAVCLGAATLLLAGLHFGESEHRAVRDQLREIPRDESGQLLVS
jgi:Na+/melibiose symporter-like transporter